METIRASYKKPEAVRELERMANAAARRKHPSVDPKHLAPRLYRDNTANDLTRCIIDFLRLSGCQAERINCTGKYLDRSHTFEDVTGKVRTIGTGQWIPTSGQRGTADISATIRGKSVKIEVKMKDRQSPDQKRYQEQVEAAGGLYWLVRSFEEFKQIFDML